MIRIGTWRKNNVLLPGMVFLAMVSQASARQSPVGVPGWKRDLVLAGSELAVRPSTHATPIVLRIDAVYPHGSAFRYDIEYYGLEAGSFDLRDYLRRKDGSSTEQLASIPVSIESRLAEGVLRPNPIESGDVPTVGGYELRMWQLAVLWSAGLLAILTIGRKRAVAGHAGEGGPPTLAGRLRPLVERGIAGRLSAEDSAQLELTLIAFWRRKLGLHDRSSAQALGYLKEHPEAGPLLAQLELWLHSPDTSADVDLAELLAPYQGLAANALEVDPRSSQQGRPGHRVASGTNVPHSSARPN